jgi:rhodanese-related sulfurtransferase
MRLPAAFYKIDSGARPILLAAAGRLFHEGRTVFLDARSGDEYVAGQIDGALSVPIDRWRELYPDLLPWIEGQKTVVYSSPDEIDAADDLAGALLSRGGARDSIFVYLGGVAEWGAAGLPIRRGEGTTLGLEPQEEETEP